MRDTALMITAEDLLSYTDINDSLDPKLITSNVVQAQQIYIEPLLGTDLYDYVVNGIQNDTITGDYQTLLDDFIQDTLLWYTYYFCLESVYTRVRNNGLLTPQGGETSNAADKEIYNDKRQSALNRAEYYANRLVKYLLDSGTSVFPQLSGNTELYKKYPDYTDQYQSPFVISKNIQGTTFAKRFGIPIVDSRYSDKYNTQQ